MVAIYVFTPIYGRSDVFSCFQERPLSRLDFPSAVRNGPAILPVLLDIVGSAAPARPRHILEVASGSGQHACLFAAALPDDVWWPSDIDPAHIESVRAWRAHKGVSNIKDPVFLDVSQTSWREGAPLAGVPPRIDAILCVNMIHIAPWEAACGLFEGAGKRLCPGGHLILYGPYKMDGRHTAPSNAAFDQSLKARDPRWGVRAREDLDELAQSCGLVRTHCIAMPANNFVLVFSA